MFLQLFLYVTDPIVDYHAFLFTGAFVTKQVTDRGDLVSISSILCFIKVTYNHVSKPIIHMPFLSPNKTEIKLECPQILMS